MLKTLSSYHVFRKHPILDRIAAEANNDLINGSHFLFIYPRIISFSFKSYSKSIKLYSSPLGETNDYNRSTLDSSLEENGANFQYSDEYKGLLSDLFSYFSKSEYRFIFVIDLRNCGIIDSTIIKELLDTLLPHCADIIIFANTKSLDQLNAFKKTVSIVNSFRMFKAKIESLLTCTDNELKIKFPRKLTINSFGESLTENDFHNKIISSYCVTLDFEQSIYFNTFALCLMNLFIRSISATYGVHWRFIGIGSNENFFEKIYDFRILDVNKFFLFSNDDYLNKTLGKNKEKRLFNKFSKKKNVRRFGVFLYNKRTIFRLINKFDVFLKSVVNMFPTYLLEYCSITDERKGTSFRPRKRFHPRSQFIRVIAKELIENVILHSDNTGYFAVELNNYHLYIFVGDCGKGLKKGITDNYDLFIEDTRDAIKHTFKLDEYTKERKLTIERFNQGFGLYDTIRYVNLLNGKMVFRSGDYFGAFMNPIKNNNIEPSSIEKSHSFIRGTQFMIVLPLGENHIETLPKTFINFIESDE